MLKFLSICIKGDTQRTDDEIRSDMHDFYNSFKMKLFPDVSDVTSQDILSMDKDSYILVDCRGSDERAVSHIPGSITKSTFLAGEYKEKLVITSCTLGVRSGKFAKQLEETISKSRIRNHSGICPQNYRVI